MLDPVFPPDRPNSTETSQVFTNQTGTEAQLHLMKTIVLHTNDAVLVTQAEPIEAPFGPQIVYVNPAFTRMTGYTLDEVIGRSPRLLQGPATERAPLDQIRLALSLWQPVRVEVLNYRKDGTPFWVELSIVPVADETGWYTHWVSVQREITLRKQREEALKKLVHNSSDLIFMLRTDGTIQYLSPSSQSILGYNSQDLIQHSILEYVHPQDKVKVQKMIEEAIEQSGLAVAFEFRLQHAELDWVYVEATTNNLLTGATSGEVAINARDITARKQAEKALATEKEQLAITLRSIEEGVITTDTTGRIVLINHCAEILTGWRQAEALNQPLSRVFQTLEKKHYQGYDDLIARVLQSGQAVRQYHPLTLVGKDGTERLIAYNATPIRDKEARVIGMVLVFRDVTEKHKMEEEWLRATKLESLGLLAGGIAHDFNNILTAILGNLSLAILNSNLSEGPANFLKEAEKAVVRATDLTQQLLTFAKGGAPIKQTALLPEIIKDSAQFILRGSRIDGQLNLPDNLWPVEVDGGQISQVIQNLVINALQAMPEGGRLRLEAQNVRLTSPITTFLPTGPYVQISIQDQGIGIRTEDLPKIFDPYFTTKELGSGLGLATCYSIIQKHGGHISVKTTLGEGSVFDIYLPASLKAKTDLVDIKKKSRDLTTGQGQILVMDDEESIRNLLKAMLRQLGYEATLSQDGLEAVRCYREAIANGKPFAAVVMDLTVPGGMGGQEALQQLLSIDPTAKVIVSSGYATDPVMANYHEYGFSGLVTKPYQLDELAKVLHSVVSEDELK